MGQSRIRCVRLDAFLSEQEEDTMSPFRVRTRDLIYFYGDRVLAERKNGDEPATSTCTTQP